MRLVASSSHHTVHSVPLFGHEVKMKVNVCTCCMLVSALWIHVYDLLSSVAVLQTDALQSSFLHLFESHCCITVFSVTVNSLIVCRAACMPLCLR